MWRSTGTIDHETPMARAPDRGRRIAPRSPGAAGVGPGRTRRENARGWPRHGGGCARLCDGASRRLEQSLLAHRRARPELGGRPQDRRLLEALRGGRARYPDRLRQPGSNLQDRARPERNNAAGARRLHGEQHRAGQAPRLVAAGRLHARQSRARCDQHRRRAFRIVAPRKALRRGTHEGGRRRHTAGTRVRPSRAGEARTNPGHRTPSANPVWREGWFRRHARACRGKDGRSRRSRHHYDHRRGRYHLGDRVRQRTGARARTDPRQPAHRQRGGQISSRACHRRSQAMSANLVLVAACALVDPDGRVLIAQRPSGKAMAGLWEFPGGKVEAGERPEQTLIRELAEELGIVVNEACLAPLTFASHAYADFHLLMPLYVCRRWDGAVTALEGQRLAWVRPNRLRDYPMPPADEPLVSHLMTLL